MELTFQMEKKNKGEASLLSLSGASQSKRANGKMSWSSHFSQSSGVCGEMRTLLFPDVENPTFCSDQRHHGTWNRNDLVYIFLRDEKCCVRGAGPLRNINIIPPKMAQKTNQGYWNSPEHHQYSCLELGCTVYLLRISTIASTEFRLLKLAVSEFPGGPVVKNLSASSGDEGLTAGLGRVHVPRSSFSRPLQPPSPMHESRHSPLGTPPHWGAPAPARAKPRTAAKAQHSQQ